jgi:hypothetical protein
MLTLGTRLTVGGREFRLEGKRKMQLQRRSGFAIRRDCLFGCRIGACGTDLHLRLCRTPPTLQDQIRNPLQMPQIVADKNAVMSQSMGGDGDIKVFKRLTL